MVAVNCRCLHNDSAMRAYSRLRIGSGVRSRDAVVNLGSRSLIGGQERSQKNNLA
jgi:hypothetical protein